MSKPTEHYSDDLKLKYIVGKNIILFENGATVTKKQFQDEELSSLEELVRKLEGTYDYRYALTTGYLRKKKGMARLEEAAKLSKKIEAPKITEEPKKPKPLSKNVFSSGISTVYIIIGVLFVIGLGSMIMSGYHGSLFLIMSRKPIIVAIATGCMMVLFSSTSPTAARFFFVKKSIKRGWVIAILFILFSIITVSYSMFSTTAVNYEQFKASAVNEAYTEEITENSKLAAEKIALEAQLAKDEASLKEYAILMETLRQDTDKKQEEYQKTINDLNYSKSKAEARLPYVQEEDLRKAIQSQVNQYASSLRQYTGYLSDLQTRYWTKQDEYQESINILTESKRQKEERLSEVSISLAGSDSTVGQARDKSRTFYDFLSQMLGGVSVDKIRFIVYLIPSVFYDIMAPFAMFVIFMLIDRIKLGKEAE